MSWRVVVFYSPIQFAENQIQVLTIEQAPMFREIVLELIDQMESKDGRFVLSVEDRILTAQMVFM